ncbi:MAG: nucleotidyltransferase [Firmicutes bacterium]|nr:nucleotidyltransferase [Bacillota bacterium]
MKTSLLIMAAGIGSRYGAGIKQLATVDSANHIIMDYSIHDAIKAGFNKIVFIIRKDIEAEFKEVIGDRIEEVCRANGVEVAYAFQSLDELPEGKRLPEGRTKPWGTGQAVLAARGLVNGPFAVINADDYYGKEAFEQIHRFLVSGIGPDRFCMAGFVLKNTLSEHGGVTRGICQVDGDGYLTDVVETKNIVKTEDGAAVDGQALDVESYVSMNMWGLAPEFMQTLEDGFVEFFENAAKADPLKAEYLLPIYIGQLLRQGRISVKVLETGDKWFGVTYQEDRNLVVESFRKLIEQGEYGEELYGDL